MFVLTGVAHFAPPLRRDLIAIVPPRLPAPGLLVTITGVLELLGAAGLLLPATRVAAAVCLLVLMLAMFPANVYASRMPNPPKSMTTRLSAAHRHRGRLPGRRRSGRRRQQLAARRIGMRFLPMPGNDR